MYGCTYSTRLTIELDILLNNSVHFNARGYLSQITHAVLARLPLPSTLARLAIAVIEFCVHAMTSTQAAQSTPMCACVRHSLCYSYL